MHKGRGGRRHWLRYLTLDPTFNNFMPYWFRPLAWTFVSFGVPITGPLAEPYQAPIMPNPNLFHWENTWVDPVTGLTFRWRFEVAIRFPLQGTTIDWSLDDLIGNFFGGTIAFSEMGDTWGPKIRDYAQTSPTNPLLINLSVPNSYYEWASWHEKP